MERPFADALVSGGLPMVKLMLDSNVCLETPLNYDRDTPLLFSIYIKKPDRVRLLVEAGSKINVYNRDKEDPLMVLLNSNMSNDTVLSLVYLLIYAGHKIGDTHHNLASEREECHLFQQALGCVNVQEAVCLKKQVTIRIRRLLSEHKLHRSILPSIDKLPLPTCLKDTLRYHHETVLIE